MLKDDAEGGFKYDLAEGSDGLVPVLLIFYGFHIRKDDQHLLELPCLKQTPGVCLVPGPTKSLRLERLVGIIGCLHQPSALGCLLLTWKYRCICWWHPLAGETEGGWWALIQKRH